MRNSTPIAPLEIFNAENCEGVMAQLHTLGISGKAVVNAGGIVWANGKFSEGRFELNPTGPRVMAVAVCHGTKIVEVVAFDEMQYGALYGDVFALGEEHLLNPPVFGGPVNVYRHPIPWMQHECDGVVILRRQDVWWQLGNYESLLSESVEHGREIERLLMPPPPRAKILVRQSKQVAA